MSIDDSNNFNSYYDLAVRGDTSVTASMTGRQNLQRTGNFTVNVMETVAHEVGGEHTHYLAPDAAAAATTAIATDTYANEGGGEHTHYLAPDTAATYEYQHTHTSLSLTSHSHDAQQYYYALRKGRFTGRCIYVQWQDIYEQVNGFVQAEYETFDELVDALIYIWADELPISTPNQLVNHGESDFRAAFETVEEMGGQESTEITTATSTATSTATTNLPTGMAAVRESAEVESAFDDSTNNMSMALIATGASPSISSPSSPPPSPSPSPSPSSPPPSPTAGEIGGLVSVHGNNNHKRHRNNNSGDVASATAALSVNQDSVPVHGVHRDWINKLQQLKRHKRKHSDITNVGRRTRLGRWISAQRTAYKKFTSGNSTSTDTTTTDGSNQMTAQKVQQLLDIDVDFFKPKRRKKATQEDDKHWNEMYEELKKFKAEHGHCVPPVRNSTPLRRWFAKQRTEYKKIRAGEESALTTQRLQLLNDIDFQFEPTKKSKSWEDRFQELVEFKEKFGHTKVPRLYGALGKWTADQRWKYGLMLQGKETNLTPEKVKRLDDIGMVWAVIKLPPVEERAERKSWAERFQELVEFKETYGHTVVPYHVLGLGNWVHAQRTNYKLMKQGRKSVMTPTQALQLADIGFAFEVLPRKKRIVRQSLGNPYPHIPPITCQDDMPSEIGHPDEYEDEVYITNDI